MKHKTIYPETCKGCRHDVRIESRWVGNEVAAISGWCAQAFPWGRGCQHYAEAAVKERSQRV